MLLSFGPGVLLGAGASVPPCEDKEPRLSWRQLLTPVATERKGESIGSPRRRNRCAVVRGECLDYDYGKEEVVVIGVVIVLALVGGRSSGRRKSRGSAIEWRVE